MSDKLIEFLLTRPPRERILMGILVLVIVPVALVFGILLPLQDQQKESLRARDEAIQLRDWVITQSLAAEQIPKISETSAAVKKPIGSSGIEQSLISADLRPAISNLDVRDTGAIELQFDRVTFTRLANWMSENTLTWGYELTEFRFEAIQESGKVSARLTLTPES
ncbi:MAG: type II secretion system protein GspM [Vibrio splendidus]